MLVIRYTGQGWLAFVLFMFVGIGCLLIPSALGMRGDGLLITFAVLYVLIGSPLHWRIGTTLNKSRPVHMFMSAPMEYWVVWYPTIAMVVAAFLLAKNGSTLGAWAIGIATLAGLILFASSGRRHWDRTQPSVRATEEGLMLYGPPGQGLPATRRALAAARGWRYQEGAPEFRRRWQDVYGAEVKFLAPRDVLAGEMGGLPFTVFNTKVNVGPLRDRPDSRRTICLVHLPVSLPDVRLRGRIVDEEALIGEMPPVHLEPPWNCDLLPRLSALSLIETGQGLPMAAESDVPGLADALVTEEVRWETLRRRVPGWRVHGRDLVFVTIPDARSSLTNHEAMAVVEGLVAIARAFPADVLYRYGQPIGADPLVR